MKLLTDMVDCGPDCGNLVLLDGHYDAPGDMWDRGVMHDAAAAHALMQALTLELPMLQLMAVKAKADELMREWGFSE